MMYHPARTCLLQLLLGDGDNPPRKAFVASTAGMVAGATLIALFVPHIQDLIGFIGGFACITYALVLPALILWRLQRRPDLTLSGPGAQWMSTRVAPLVVAWLLVNASFSYLGAAFSLRDMLGGGAT